ncbi:cytochrome c3 family protein [Desulfobacula sp.]|uniref:cytochrome c3 family protein n=1 Tax=Desulfobacula sp. TaxID=2593537 RepID=UPI0039B99CD8
MKKESYGQHIIFIIILILIFFLSYYAIPLPEPVSNHKISKKAQTKVITGQKDKLASVEKKSIVKKSEKSEPDTIKAKPEEVSVQPVAKVEEPKVEEPKVETKKVETGTDKGGNKASIDIIAMDNPGYSKHKKGIVLFTHKKHIEDYSIACGTCHHDEKGKPLELTLDDKVQGCIECHKETEKPKGEKLGEKEKIAKYHFEALHANCIDCHKKYNIEKGDPKGKGPAPTSCTQCHPKE